jgi:hypothetical protein
MSDEKDWDYVAKLEKAIGKKYGHETIANPKSGWTKEKEESYIEQLKSLEEKNLKNKMQSEKIEMNGFLVSKKLLNKEVLRKCSVCEKYSFDMKDDVYMIKFDCCFRCYVEYVENREERWFSGWRPEIGEIKCHK